MDLLNPQPYLLANALSFLLLALNLFQFWVWGFTYGTLARRAFKALAPRHDDLPAFLFETLTGSLLFGLALFVITWGLQSFQLSAMVLTFSTLGMAICLRKHISRLSLELARKLRTGFKSLNRLELAVFCLVVTLVFLNFLRSSTLQNHGDQYLYHLEIGRPWTERAIPQILVSNITSGYSWSVEVIYVYFRQIVGGDSTLVLLSQQFHTALSLIGCLILSYGLLRPHLSRSWALGLQLVFLQPQLNQMVFCAKNDGVSFLLAFATLFVALRRRWTELLLLSPVLLSAKITTAISLAAIGTISLLREALENRRTGYFPKASAIWITAAIVSVIGISPYLMANFIQTGNPLFPILNNLFRSPLVPETAQSIVGEMAPLQLSFLGYWTGWFDFAKEHFALLAMAPVALYMAIAGKLKDDASKAKKDALVLASTAILGMTFLQLFLNQYGNRIEPRHFKIVQYALPLSTILILSRIEYPKFRQASLWVVALGALAVSHTDVLVRDFFLLTRVHGIKEHYFERRPFNKILDEISLSPDLCTDCQVLAVGRYIEGYFLKKGTLLLANIHGELFKAKSQSPEHLSEALTTLHLQGQSIIFGLIEEGYEDTPEGVWIRNHMHIVKRHETFSLYKLNGN